MPEELVIEDVETDVLESEQGDPVPNDEHKKKISSIIDRMVEAGESEEDIDYVINEYKKNNATTPITPKSTTPTPAGFDITQRLKKETGVTPVSKKFASGGIPKTMRTPDAPASGTPEELSALSAERNAPIIYNQEAIDTAINDQTQMIANEGVDAALEIANDAWKDYVKKMSSEALRTKGGLDGVPVNHIQNIDVAVQKSISESTRKPDKKDAAMLLIQAQEIPELQRRIINKVIAKSSNPNEAMYRQYLIDRGSNPASQAKVLHNAARLKRGEIKYNVETGALTEDVGIVKAITGALIERKNENEGYKDLSTSSYKDASEKMDRLIEEENDSERVYPVAEGITAAAGGAIGTYLPEMIGTGIVAATAVPTFGGSIVASGLLGGAAAAGSFYQREYYRKRLLNYSRLVNQGMPKIEASKLSDEIATKEAVLDAAVNVATSSVGVGGAAKAAGKLSKGWMGVVTEGLGQNIKNIVPLAGGAVGVEIGKNKIEQEAGVKGIDTLANTGDVIGQTVAMVMGFHLGAKVINRGFKLGKEATKKLFNGLAKIDEKTLKESVAEAVDIGAVRPEEVEPLLRAVEAERALDEKVPPSVKDEDARIAAQDVVTKIEALEAKKEVVPKSLHDEINLEIDKQKARLEEIKNPKPEVKVEEPVKVEPKKELPTEFTKHEEADIAIDDLFKSETAPIKQGMAALAGKEKLPVGEVVVDGKKTNFDDYVRKARKVVSQLFPGTEIIVHNTSKDFEAATKQSSTLGWFDGGKNIHLNLELIGGEGRNNIAFHEVIHPILREVANNDMPVFREMYEQLKALKGNTELAPVWEHAKQYPTVGEGKVEAVTEFISLVADGKIDISKIDKSLITKVIEYVNIAFEMVGIDYRISTADDLRTLSEAVKKAFETEDASHIEKIMGKRKRVAGSAAAALAKDNPSLYDKVKDYLSRAKNSTDDELVATLKKHLPEDEARAIVNEVRGTKPEVVEPVAKKSGVSVTMPSEVKRAEVIPLKKAETKTTPVEPVAETIISGEPGTGAGISHAATAEVRKELGLPEREVTYKSDKELEAEVNEALKKDPDAVNKLLDDLETKDTKETSDVGQALLRNKSEELKAAIEKDPTNKQLQAEYSRFAKITEQSGTDLGRAFRQRRDAKAAADDTTSLADMLESKKRVNKVDELTDAQIAEVVKDYAKVKQSTTKAVEDLLALHNERSRLDAEDALKTITDLEAKNKALQEKVDSKKGTKTVPKTKKTVEDHLNDVKDAAEAAREALRKLRGQTKVTIVPYANELIAVAPHVAKMVASLAKAGVTKLDDVAKAIVKNFEGDIPGITHDDAIDLIAGVHNPKKQTQGAIKKDANDLKAEAKLLIKLRDLNETKPKTEKELQSKNKKEAELKNSLTNLSGESVTKDLDAAKLKSLIANNERRSKEYAEKLSKGDFAPAERRPLLEDEELQKRSPELFEKAQQSMIQRQKDKYDWDLAKARDEYNSKSSLRKKVEGLGKVLSIPRELESSGDFSFSGKQGLVMAINNPKLFAKAFVAQFKAAGSKKYYEDWFHTMGSSRYAEIAKKSGVRILDPNDPNIIARGEEYLSGGLGTKIPIAGKLLIAPSERAYTFMSNKMKLDKFTVAVDAMEANGLTFENSPELYKGWASIVNNETGSGGLGMLEPMSGILSSALFSPRLWASRLNLLGISDIIVPAITLGKKKGFYANLPPELRLMVAGDVLKTIGFGVTILLTAKAAGADVEIDPRSSDFGKIVIGNTRYDVWGGFQQNVVAIAQILKNEKISAGSRKVKKLGEGFGAQTRGDVALGMIRKKLAPLPALALDVSLGRTVMGEKIKYTTDPVRRKEINLQEKAGDFFLPFGAEGWLDTAKDPSIKKAVDVIVNAFGVSANDYSKKEKNN